MKKVYLLFFICYLLITPIINAASPNPDPVKDVLDEQVSELKDKIASKVAELNLVEKRGIIGTVTDVTGTQITMSDLKSDTRFVDVDELTKFSGEDPSFGFSDIKKGMSLSVVGLYNKQSRRILARLVEEKSLIKILHGFVATIDPENFIIYIASSNNEQITVDVETTTKTFSYDQEEKDILRSGFSKIKEGQSIFVVGSEDRIDADRIDADRIIIFPNVIKGPAVNLSPSITPSTGSGRKLTPITQ